MARTFVAGLFVFWKTTPVALTITGGVTVEMTALVTDTKTDGTTDGMTAVLAVTDPDHLDVVSTTTAIVDPGRLPQGGTMIGDLQGTMTHGGVEMIVLALTIMMTVVGMPQANAEGTTDGTKKMDLKTGLVVQPAATEDGVARQRIIRCSLALSRNIGHPSTKIPKGLRQAFSLTAFSYGRISFYPMLCKWSFIVVLVFLLRLAFPDPSVGLAFWPSFLKLKLAFQARVDVTRRTLSRSVVP